MSSKDNKGIFEYNDLKAFSYRGPSLIINDKLFKCPADLIKESLKSQ
jgi:hypothetical protein